jgi:signal transduction histidine kinase
LARGERLYHLTITPIYVQATGGTALLNVLVAGYDVDRGVAENLKRSTGGSEFVFLSQGRVVAATLPAGDAVALPRQISLSPATIRVGKTQYAPLITTLADIDGAPVGQLAILRSFDAANEAIADLRRTLNLLWLISMAAGLALTYVLARRIIEPVKELDRAATEVSRQNYDCVVAVRSEDELGRLAATFNAMCASIRQGREELIRSERVTTIGRLATSVVHDLRNPLAAIYGGAEMLAYSDLSPEQVQRLSRNMYRASLHMQELLQDLLEVGRGKTGQPEQCDLREIVAEVMDSLSSAAEAQSTRLVLEVPEGLELLLDTHLFKRVFANLIGNAMEAMLEGGSVTVSAKRESESVLVEVRDTGPGIAPEIRDHLFQPFSTSRKGKGLGLGLALARQVVVDHGGEMWADSPPGQGACLSFRLPASAREEATPSVAAG